jgi:hypothetical protein
LFYRLLNYGESRPREIVSDFAEAHIYLWSHFRIRAVKKAPEYLLDKPEKNPLPPD